MGEAQLRSLLDEVVDCRKCPRLVEWRETVAEEKVARFADQKYWGRPVPSFGDPAARILVLGLAPAAHGGNRTGRIFTGDRSGDFLFASIYRCGLSNSAISIGRDDGLTLDDVWVSAVNRCAPPSNKPTPAERDNCLPYLVREIEALDRLKVVVALGSYAWDGALRAMSELDHRVKPSPKFGHGHQATVGPVTLLGCFHPSQQNTFTGRLTPAMIDEVFERAKLLARP